MAKRTEDVHCQGHGGVPREVLDKKLPLGQHQIISNIYIYNIPTGFNNFNNDQPDPTTKVQQPQHIKYLGDDRRLETQIGQFQMVLEPWLYI